MRWLGSVMRSAYLARAVVAASAACWANWQEYTTSSGPRAAPRTLRACVYWRPDYRPQCCAPPFEAERQALGNRYGRLWAVARMAIAQAYMEGETRTTHAET